MARIYGKWKENQVVSTDWIKKSITPRFDNVGFSGGYGYQWWLPEQADINKCLSGIAQNRPFNHDYIFHTMLSMLKVESSVYQASLDIFSLCRKNGSTQNVLLTQLNE